MREIIFLASIVLMLSACSSGNPTEIQTLEDVRFNGIDGEINIITDNETGCKYLFVDYGRCNYRTTTMSPLMKNKDEVDCGQSVKENN